MAVGLDYLICCCPLYVENRNSYLISLTLVDIWGGGCFYLWMHMCVFYILEALSRGDNGAVLGCMINLGVTFSDTA